MFDETDIVDRIISDIHAGRVGANDKLPSENELADNYRVPRMIVRKAYERLQQLGYSYSIQGKGNYVRDRQLQIPLLLAGNQSFSKKMKELGLNYESRNIGCVAIPYDAQMYQALDAAPDEMIYQIKRLRIINLQPIAIHVSHVRAKLFPSIAEEGLSITSLFTYFESKGYTCYESSQSKLSVAFPSRTEREWLQCSSLIPVIVVESGCKDPRSGAVLEHSQILYRSDRFTYVI